MTQPKIDKEKSKLLADTKFVKLYDLAYQDGMHYYDASRRNSENLLAFKTTEELKSVKPDAVSGFIIIELPNQEPQLLLFYEYRYPVGQYSLGVPAGLIDPDDWKQENPLTYAMARELKEETGIQVTDKDTLEVIEPLAFTTAGLTDESNALVKGIIHLDSLDVLNHDGAEGTENFGSFELVNKEDAIKLFKQGKDDSGHFYSLITWSALLYFISDLWKK